MEEGKNPVVIVGTGPEAKIAADILGVQEVLVYGFLSTDDKFDLDDINDVPVLGALIGEEAETLLDDEYMKIAVAEREIPKRHQVVDYLRDKKPELVTVMHPSVILSPHARIGRGNIIQPLVVIHANAMIGSFNLIETGVVIEPEVEIGDFCTIQAGAIIARGAAIQPDVFIGHGAIIGPKVQLGQGAVIGAGSVVLREVDEFTTVFGNPAKKVG